MYEFYGFLWKIIEDYAMTDFPIWSRMMLIYGKMCIVLLYYCMVIQMIVKRIEIQPFLFF